MKTPLYEVIGSHPPDDGHRWKWQRRVVVASPDADSALRAALAAFPLLDVCQVLRRAPEADLLVPELPAPSQQRITELETALRNVITYADLVGSETDDIHREVIAKSRVALIGPGRP